MRLILLLAFICSSAVADPMYGHDVIILGGQSKNALSQIGEGRAIGFLDILNPYPNLEFLWNKKHPQAFRGHLIDGTVNGHACSGNATNLPMIRKAARKFQAFCDGKNTKCFVSPVLEHGCKNKALVDKWFAILRKEAPRMQYVCSALNAYCPSNVLIEKHGNKTKADIVSNDGNSIYDGDTYTRTSNGMIKDMQGSVITFAWSNCDNGRTTGEKVFVPISNRVNWCKPEDYQQKEKLLGLPDNMPSIEGCKPFKGKELLKTNAEYYGKTDDGRGNKPLLILNKNYGRISIQKLDGKEVACAKYYGPFSGGGFRHYVGSCSGENPVELLKDFGGEWGLAKAGGKCWLVNAVRRQGFFR